MSGYTQLGAFLGGDPFSLLLEYAGTFAGAISGVRLASVKRFDWFGASVIGFVTSLGGGTLRDMCLNVPPFWMTGPSYVITTLLATVAVAVFGRRFISERITWFAFDTVAISLFTVFGLEKTLACGYQWWCAIMMGVITAVFGGVLRDVLINEVPLIFRKELYAMACFAGAMVYVLLDWAKFDSRISSLCCIVVIFILRALAIKYGWSVPVLKGHAHHLSMPWKGSHPPSARHHRDVRPDGECKGGLDK